MEIKDHFRQNRDNIHSGIMELACDLAAKRLMDTHDKTFDHFVENVSDDEDDGTRYKDEFQSEFDGYYDEEYGRIAKLFKFDHTEDDGVLKE